ncbi:hypothetical protein G6F50_017197 [Rhizopus delemar]|uniref:Major facilitator superfamily (MFS) profile domain-containing protein n=1 Tax=Rhizopus delemar TaxID=936053 RepID=A0A9P6XRQ0_9FUNG|nr:hypothetical protein G6F50_017197 [Rhizopus delemar]
MEEAREQSPQRPMPASGETSLWRDRRFQLSMPAILASPFISTGFFFHQVRLASEMRWSMAWVATAFVAYAVARVAGMIAAGPLIDRFAASRVLPVVTGSRSRISRYSVLPQRSSMFWLRRSGWKSSARTV